MSLQTGFARLKREIGIKKCIILDGNVGDIYLENKKLLNIKEKVEYILKQMNYDKIVYWDSVSGMTTDEETYNSLYIVDNEQVEGEDYDESDEDVSGDDNVQDNEEYDEDQSGEYRDPSEIFSIILRNFPREDMRVVYVINWADYVFDDRDLPQAQREWLTLLGKAIKEKKVNPYEYKNSTIIMITNKLSMIPISLYLNNPDVSCINISKPDREEREKIMKHINANFDVKLPDNESFKNSKNFDEYVDILDGFTSSEIVQMAMLSEKESYSNKKIPFEQLYLLFKYGEKDNPWEKLKAGKIKKIAEYLSDRVIGQDEAIDKVKKVVIKAYMGLSGVHKTSSHSAPKGVLFFVGPTGVGKTEISKALAKFLFGDEQACIRFDMSEYAEENSDQKLIGAPPGYVGYEEGGQLTNAIIERPFSIILFDEIEKAAKNNPRILDIFLQILEDGRLTDSKGQTVSFSESIIIFTSNLGAADVSYANDNHVAAKEFVKIVKKYFDSEIKRPEILGRIGENNIVPFNFIKDKDFQYKIASSKLLPIKNMIQEKYKLELELAGEREVVSYILTDVDMKKGGRAIMNAINDKFLDPLALFLFENEEDLRDYRGAKLTVKVREDNLQFAFEND